MRSFTNIRIYYPLVKTITRPSRGTPIIFNEYIRVFYAPSDRATSKYYFYEWLTTEEAAEVINRIDFFGDMSKKTTCCNTRKSKVLMEIKLL